MDGEIFESGSSSSFWDSGSPDRLHGSRGAKSGDQRDSEAEPWMRRALSGDKSIRSGLIITTENIIYSKTGTSGFSQQKVKGNPLYRTLQDLLIYQPAFINRKEVKVSKPKLPVDVSLFLIQTSGPQPFGLTLGEAEKGEAKKTVEREGGKWFEDERKHPATSKVKIYGLPIEHLVESEFWFFENVLFAVNYVFSVSLDQKEFNELMEKLKTRYGCPIKFTAPLYKETGAALWKFGDVEVELAAPRMSEKIYLEYRHLPLAQEAVTEEAYYSFSSKKKDIKKNEKGL